MILYIGHNYYQTCDSQGSHNNATLIDNPDGTTTVKWLATKRTSGSWDNIYIYDKLYIALPALAARFKLIVDVLVNDLSNLNGVEFEDNSCQNQRRANMAWQFLQASPYKVSTFDFGNTWIKAFNLNSAPFTANKWTRFCSITEINGQGPHHLGIQYQNEYLPVNIQRNYVEQESPNFISWAVQFDSLNKGTEIDATIMTRLIVE